MLVKPGTHDVALAELGDKAHGHFSGALSSDPFIGNCMLIEPRGSLASGNWSGALDHPNLKILWAYAATWPEAVESISIIAHGYTPLLPPEWDPEQRGSTSGHDINGDGSRTMYSTIYDPIGAWEAVLHELYHLRLWCFGIGLESHDGELLDHPLDDSEVWISPIRKDKRRPMSACLHGWLAWIALTQGDLKLVESEVLDAKGVASVHSMMRWNLPKIEEGLITFKEHSRWTANGQQFWAELEDWAVEVIARGWTMVGWEGRDDAHAANREWVESTNVPQSPLHGTD